MLSKPLAYPPTSNISSVIDILELFFWCLARKTTKTIYEHDEQDSQDENDSGTGNVLFRVCVYPSKKCTHVHNMLTKSAKASCCHPWVMERCLSYSSLANGSSIMAKGIFIITTNVSLTANISLSLFLHFGCRDAGTICSSSGQLAYLTILLLHAKANQIVIKV